MKSNNIKHNLSGTRLYNIYHGMIQRCYNLKNKRYKYYGGKGIKISKEWINNFMVFYNWSIKNGYHDSLTIDRIDNDKGYFPDNCRWTTKNVQARNTRILMETNTSGYRGVYIYKHDRYKSMIMVDNKNKFLGCYNTKLEAAKAYDSYIIINNLEHTKNDVITDNNLTDIKEHKRLRKTNKTGFIGVYIKSKNFGYKVNTLLKKNKYIGTEQTAIKAAKCREEFIYLNHLTNINKLNFSTLKDALA